MSAPPVIGIDVGSTTVKVVCLEPGTREIAWSAYRRHETRQAEAALAMLAALEAERPDVAPGSARAFLTGSGARPLLAPLGGRFVQEVNAVTLAVEALHPDAGSVIELGGQDAKIIFFPRDPRTGEKQPVASMNDKCASGTGATIDKCLLKTGVPPAEAAALRFDGRKLHKVAAKCGVFAETDIVNLIKSGIPAPEVLCSLADAIVHQNLAVLTRGSTLLHKVLLLGGPNTYLRFLQECWRVRIPETWRERGHGFPEDEPIESLIEVPRNSHLYAAYGAAVYGLEEPQASGYRGAEALAAFLEEDRKPGARRQGRPGSGPALVRDADELLAFYREFPVERFVPARFGSGETVRAAIGLDGGSTSSKAVLLGANGEVLFKAYRLSKGNPIQDAKDLLQDLEGQVARQGARLEVLGLGATGYAADVLEEALGADVNLVETIAHQQSAVHLAGEVDVICDIGGQDIKVLFLQNGEVKDFRLSNQCSAGNGMLLQAMADQFGVPIGEYAETAFRAACAPVFSYGCAVFLDSDRVNFQKEGYTREELLAGLALVLPKNVWQYVVQVPRLATLGRSFVLQGGTQHNLAAVKAQVDYIRARVPGAKIRVHPHCGEAGAIGAALEALRVVRRRGSSSFIGLEAATALRYTTRNDETTRCRFCPNLCSRTFVDTETPQGRTSRYIAGFSCEKGTVESKEALKRVIAERKALKEKHLNLVEYEARLAFEPFYTPEPLPEAGARAREPAEGLRRWRWGWTAGGRRRRGFERSRPEAAARRRTVRIGIPRVLNLYSTAPFFRAYFETLGLPSRNLRFSPPTTEEMYREGARYGSVDPCFPSKAAQAHVHHLLFKGPAREPLDFIFFPSITHLPTFVVGAQDSASCPIVAGTPSVVRAAFTKEVDFFARQGVRYVDGTLTLVEPSYLKKQLWEMWSGALEVTRDESDFAVEQGLRALRRFTEEMERRGLEVLEQVEAEHRLALLLLARPYHGDPGLNHGLLDEFQALGYPILSIRSIPKDPGWLARWFREDLEQGRVRSPLEIGDVWPENYSANSVQKVWAAKFAARHPNVAVLDLSSFKCGHDAPTYGLIDEILKAARKPSLALHDLDANKPAGSQKIRVRTYAHALARHREALADRAARMSELERSVAAKRRELLAERRAALARQGEVEEMERAFARYLEEEEPVLGLRSEDLERAFPAGAPDFDRAADVAPLEPQVDVVSFRPPAAEGSELSMELPVLASRGGGGRGAGCASGCGLGFEGRSNR